MSSSSATRIAIVGAARTAVTGFGGSLSSLQAPELGALAAREALRRAGVRGEDVDEFIGGNVLGAGLGQAPARQAALAAGVREGGVCTTLNKMCASGMKAVSLGAQSLVLNGDTTKVVLAGGFESMSNAPFLLPKARFGMKMGHGKVMDSMIVDGLWDAYGGGHMGECAELTAEKFDLSKAAQDAYAVQSYHRSIAAARKGLLAKEIFPVEVKAGRGKVKVVDEDDEPGRFESEAVVEKIKPAFKRDGGTITAANASTISDGAAFMVLMTEAEAEKRGLKPMAFILSSADAEQAPVEFTTAPSLAVPIALRRAGMAMEDVGVWEINEAFACVALANQSILNIENEKLNVHGGAISIGHPIGASGARIMMSLMTAMEATGERFGAAAICNGGGGASAVVLERA